MSNIINLPQANLSPHEKQKKLLYISELLSKDPQFDKAIRTALKKAFKKCPELSKPVTLKQMTDEEILDINNPIE